MNIRLVSSAVILAALIGGCTTSQPAIGGSPATAQQLDALRARYAAQKPGTIVGAIIAVLPEEKLAAVGGVPAEKFLINDTVSIINAAEDTLAFGQVVRRLESGDTVHVKYTSKQSARPPVPGDLVIRFPR